MSHQRLQHPALPHQGNIHPALAGAARTHGPVLPVQKVSEMTGMGIFFRQSAEISGILLNFARI